MKQIFIALMLLSRVCSADVGGQVNIAEKTYPSYFISYDKDWFELGVSFGQTSKNEIKETIFIERSTPPMPIVVRKETISENIDINIFEIYTTASYTHNALRIGLGPQITILEYGESEVLFGGRVFGELMWNDISLIGGYKWVQDGYFDTSGFYTGLSINF